MTVSRNEAGKAWSDLAQLDPLAAVLDPGDRVGAKNRAIDRIHKRALARAVGNVRGRRVLDLGCGTGRLSSWLAARGAQVVGVDMTPEMIDVARRLVPAAQFQVIDGEMLPFADADFDLVVTAYVLQYYVHTDSPLVREMSRVLRPGCRVVAIEQATDDSGTLGRGGAVADYRRMFGRAGLGSVEAISIRLGDSRLVGTVQYRPALLRLPGLARLAALEAGRSRAPLVGSRYADVLLMAER